MTYKESASGMFETTEAVSKSTNLMPSIGLLISDGKVMDVVPDSAAAKAGLAPGMKLVAVNGRKFTADELKLAVAETKSGGKLELLTETGDFYKTFKVEYKGGARYPALEQIADTPELLGEIFKRLEKSGEK